MTYLKNIAEREIRMTFITGDNTCVAKFMCLKHKDTGVIYQVFDITEKEVWCQDMRQDNNGTLYYTGEDSCFTQDDIARMSVLEHV